MSHFKLNIYTPNGIVESNYDCDELTIPTSTGFVNILKGHTHFISELGNGILTAKSGGSNKPFCIAGGLCKVLGSSVTILAKTSECATDIDLERAKKAEAKAKEKLEGSVPSVELIKYQRKLERAKNRIKLANLK